MSKRNFIENQLFIKRLEDLKSKGVSYASVARNIGIGTQKIIDIKNGRSTADGDLLSKLLELYPDKELNIDDLFKDNPIILSETLAEKEKRIKELLEEINHYRKLYETSEEKNKKMIDIIDRLTKKMNGLKNQ